MYEDPKYHMYLWRGHKSTHQIDKSFVLFGKNISKVKKGD